MSVELKVLFWFAAITQAMFDALRGSEVETVVPEQPREVIVRIAMDRLKDRELVVNELGQAGMEKLTGMLVVWADQLKAGRADPGQPAEIRKMLAAA